MNVWEIIFFILTAFWVGEFVFKRGKENKERTTMERRSFRLILLMTSLTILLTIFFNMYSLFHIEESPLMRSIGILIYGGGILLRYWGIKELGQFFSRDVIVEDDLELVSSGPYRKLRHPLYTGLLLILIGFPIYMGVWIGVIVTALLVLPMLLYRISIEEKMMSKSIGVGYEEWGKSRNRLIPYIY
ncbi:methyltransferase family protein [Guptibacillus algicola]|uniref:methyltransferase family protein n=1 Tax=Guptibacillus algicola TaxID=225844 RepID=UPI001CD29B2B|nr:isoprenylcysteine carboxylmethyltransferase family protein [Alkalihalobacillus algicola]MCA0986489.1 isoprenylcysteine carboxylmethyltransferase family protein [Alkalihalobacillus algicola]